MTLPLEGGAVAHVRDLFPPDLWATLVSAADASAAVQKVVYSKHRNEAVRLWPIFQERSGPMASETLRRKLTDEARARGLGGLDDETLERVLRPYVVALMTLSEDVLAESFRRWNAGEYFGGKKALPGLSETMPTAHQLQDLAQPALKEVQTVAWRLRRISEAVARMTPPEVKRDRPTKADLVAQGILDENGRDILTKPAPIPEAF